MFSARVRRLALSPENAPLRAPCAERAPPDALPGTSVWAAHGVLVGVVSHYDRDLAVDWKGEVGGKGGGGHTARRYALDVQVHNAGRAGGAGGAGGAAGGAGRGRVYLGRVRWRARDPRSALRVEVERAGLLPNGRVLPLAPPGSGARASAAPAPLEEGEELRFVDFLDVGADEAPRPPRPVRRAALVVVMMAMILLSVLLIMQLVQLLPEAEADADFQSSAARRCGGRCSWRGTLRSSSMARHRPRARPAPRGPAGMRARGAGARWCPSRR